MMEFIDLSVPFTPSGKFIELHQIGALQNVEPVWVKYCRCRKQLAGVEEKLSSCNDLGSMLQFRKKCRQQSKDFEKEIQLLVNYLERLKVSLKEQLETICSQLGAVDPSLVHFALAFAETRSSDGCQISTYSERKSGFEVLKRDWVIKTNPDLTSDQLCKRFDVEEIPVSLHWTEQFHEVDCWRVAYKNVILRKRIHKMISDSKRRLRSP
jgi:hypothetical protein